MKKILMILVLVLVLLVGCKMPEIETSCPDYIINNMPETLTFASYEKFIPQGSFLIDNLKTKWKDGSSIAPIIDTGVFMSCRTAQKGESINYFYCDDIKYVKTFISEEGIVGNTVKHKIILVLDKEPLSSSMTNLLRRTIETIYKVVDYKCFRL